MTGEHGRTEHPPLILVVEHAPEIGNPLVDQLAADGYRARQGRTAEHARALARARRPDLVLLGELESPRAALELLAEIRGGHPQGRGGTESPWPVDLPLIVVGSYAEESDLLRAFELGADDFLARPARYLQLRARLRALLRRAGAGRPGHVEVGPLQIDVCARAVRLHGRSVELRRLEFELLLQLAREPERVFAKRELMQAVWGDATPTRTLDTHCSRLRSKLRVHRGERWVINVRGVGYRLI